MMYDLTRLETVKAVKVRHFVLDIHVGCNGPRFDIGIN